MQVWAGENFHPKVNQDLKDPAFLCKTVVFRLDRLCSYSTQHLLCCQDSPFFCSLPVAVCTREHAHTRVHTGVGVCV